MTHDFVLKLGSLLKKRENELALVRARWWPNEYKIDRLVTKIEVYQDLLSMYPASKEHTT